MGKIKLKLESGAVIEKPIINAFSSNGSSYVVLDNEMNGSMGLPIILVSKIDNNKLVKIIDQNEWQNVKEYLKSIIAGNPMESIKLNPEMPADDIYFTQLTLPVSSFDALKNAYKVEEESAPADEVTIANINLDDSNNIVTSSPEVSSEVSAPEPEAAPVSVESPMPSAVEEPSIPNIEVAPEAPMSAEANPEANSEVSVITPIEAPMEEPVSAPVESNIVESAPELPKEPEVNVHEGNGIEREPLITPTPIIESPVENKVVTEDMFKEQKEAFMQACENMFDALVQKFEKELENHKN